MNEKARPNYNVIAITISHIYRYIYFQCEIEKRQNTHISALIHCWFNTFSFFRNSHVAFDSKFIRVWWMTHIFLIRTQKYSSIVWIFELRKEKASKQAHKNWVVDHFHPQKNLKKKKTLSISNKYQQWPTKKQPNQPTKIRTISKLRLQESICVVFIFGLFLVPILNFFVFLVRVHILTTDKIMVRYQSYLYLYSLAFVYQYGIVHFNEPFSLESNFLFVF